MGRIRVLDDQLVNRIAAGEVVERPASVLKELVENAVDAGASTVEVELVGGGKGEVRVVDDGEGMDRDDCLLSLERHATSKLRKGDPLDAIRTLGFRGEALPSIASVAHVTLRSAAEHGAGTEIEVRGGRIESVRDASLPRGTTVEVRRLFFNVPARRKFLRADTTELRRCVRVVTQAALAHPGVAFRLRNEGRSLIDAPAAAGRRERVASLFGAGAAERLAPFRIASGAIVAEGLAGRPADALGNRDAQHLFVNGRPVQDRLLLSAVARAYGDTMPKGRHPAVLVFLDLPPEAVDVNVHPQKTEVRFPRPSEVHDVVREAVASALGRRETVPALADLRPREEAVPWAVAEPPPSSPPPRLLEEEGLAPPRALALVQYRESYIVAEDGEGILLVDQHVAHERVLYERYLAAAEEDRVEIQRLLFPRTADLSPESFLAFEEEREEWRRLGFLAEPFGGTTVRLDGVPAFAKEVDPVALFSGIVGEAAATLSPAVREDSLRRKLVTTAACQAAIKVNYPLTREGMQRLLDDLFRTENPTTCPHGRPILFRLTLDEIERAFRRR